MWIFSGANTYTGQTIINNGTLSLDNAGSSTARLANTSNVTVNAGGTLLLSSSAGSSSNRINNSATMTLNGGTFNTGGFSEGSTSTAGVGALTLQANSGINLGSAASILHYADSHLASWTSSVILSITNWSGLATGGGTDQLLFGTTLGGLSAGQLAEIQFVDPFGLGGIYSAQILANGEVVPLSPIPEPSTWVAGALALLALGCTQRRRFKLGKN